jgi:hypothetical protein
MLPSLPISSVTNTRRLCTHLHKNQIFQVIESNCHWFFP